MEDEDISVVVGVVTVLNCDIELDLPCEVDVSVEVLAASVLVDDVK